MFVCFFSFWTRIGTSSIDEYPSVVDGLIGLLRVPENVSLLGVSENVSHVNCLMPIMNDSGYTSTPPPPLQLKIAGQWTVDSKLDSGQWTKNWTVDNGQWTKNWTVMDSGQWTKISTVHLLQLIFRGQWTVDKTSWKLTWVQKIIF